MPIKLWWLPWGAAVLIPLGVWWLVSSVCWLLPDGITQVFVADGFVVIESLSESDGDRWEVVAIPLPLFLGFCLALLAVGLGAFIAIWAGLRVFYYRIRCRAAQPSR